jgi:hypothetical protein
MDDDIVEFAKRLGMDPRDFEDNDVATMAKRFGLRSESGVALNLQRVLSMDVPRSDPWAGRDLLEPPFAGPIPVVLVGEVDLDPLEFSLELTRPALLSEVGALTEWIAAAARYASSDEDDHVSAWSEAEAGTLGDAGAPIISWYLDAALASPATIRKLIDDTTQHVFDSGLPALRLLVGHIGRL